MSPIVRVESLSKQYRLGGRESAYDTLRESIDEAVRTPFKRRRYRPKLSRRQKAVNRAHAKIRARGERAIATLKTWKVLIKLRCCPRRATAIVQAILVLHGVEANRYAG